MPRAWKVRAEGRVGLGESEVFPGTDRSSRQEEKIRRPRREKAAASFANESR